MDIRIKEARRAYLYPFRLATLDTSKPGRNSSLLERPSLVFESMHRYVFLFALLVFAGGLHAQPPAGFDLSNYGVRIDPDKRLIVVLSALEAAGTKGSDGKFQSVLN